MKVFFIIYTFRGLVGWHKNDMKFLKESILPEVIIYNVFYIKNIIELIVLHTN